MPRRRPPSPVPARARLARVRCCARHRPSPATAGVRLRTARCTSRRASCPPGSTASTRASRMLCSDSPSGRRLARITSRAPIWMRTTVPTGPGTAGTSRRNAPAASCVRHRAGSCATTLRVERHGRFACAAETRDGVARRQVRHRAGRTDRTALDDHEMRGELGDVVEVVGDHHDGERHLSPQGRELVAQRFPQRPVHRGERLIEQQHRRVARQRPGESDALLFASGQRRGPALRESLQPGECEQRLDACVPLAGRPVTDRERELLPHGEVRKERVVLEDEAHRPAMRRQRPCRPRYRSSAVRRRSPAHRPCGGGPRWPAAPSTCRCPTVRTGP